MQNADFLKNVKRNGRVNTVFCLLTVLLLAFSAFQTTLAAFKVVNESVHEIDMANVKARIIEQYEPASGVYPGNTVDKVVNVSNTGNSDCVVRVAVEKAWGESRGDDGKLIADGAYSTDNILIEYNTEYWLYDNTDGYFYYKGVLKPGETTLKPLFKEFTVDSNTGNEYKGLQADIAIKMECVQAAANGISVWDKSLDDIGVTTYESNTEPEIDAKVTFSGKDDEFIFDPGNTDLFVNFNRLLPGETKSQTVVIQNDYYTKTAIEVFLRAEDINQSFADPETLDLVNRLLREYATIVITDQTGKTIYSGPIWGEPYGSTVNPESMRYDISLGEMKTGDVETLNIQLRLDADMGDEYQSLLGLIKWVWSAENIQPPGETDVIISGSKTWRHGSNPVNERPKELVIYVKANGVVIVTETVTAADHWKWSFKLPKYDDHAEEIQYTVDEAPIPDYTTEINGSDVTNTHKTYEEITVSGNKTWDHGRNSSKRPGSIVIHVKDGDTVAASRRVTENDGWQWTFTLPKYDANGDVAVYTIEEESVLYYTLVSKDGYNLKNKFKDFDYPGDGPKTGDTSNIWMWAGLMAASLAALILLVILGRKSKRKDENTSQTSAV